MTAPITRIEWLLARDG
jgi:GYF domain 2